MVKIKTVFTILTYCITLLGVAPVFPYLDMVSRVAFIAAFLFGCRFDMKGRGHIQGYVPTVISVAFFFFYAFQFDRDNLIIPAMNLLVVLLAVRLTGEKTERNSMQIVALSLFALAGSTLLNLSMAFLVYLVVFLISIAVFLVFLTFHSFGNRQTLSRPELKKTVAVALAMPVLSFPLLMIFFVIIPRTQYPLWNFLDASGQKVTGFSEKVEPGSAASVTETKNVVFRARSPRLSVQELYWRGIVLNTIEERAWIRSEKTLTEISRIGTGRTVQQTIYPEPNASRYLVTMNVPVDISGIRANREADHIFVRSYFRQKRIKYDAVSLLTDVIKTVGKIDREMYLGMPERTSPRVLSLADDLSARGKSAGERLALLENYFSQSRFSYSNKDLPRSSDPTDEFLFAKKSGNCEYFASSFAVLLRAMGIPSRLVGGYFGGTYNDLGGYYVVTEDMAHVWLEAYIDGKGWLMIDPSKFSAGYKPLEKLARKRAFDGVFLLADSLGYYWNQMIINYDLEKQLSILRKTNEAVRGVRFSFNRQMLIYLILPVLLCYSVFIFRRKCRYVSKEKKIIKRFLDKIGRKYPAAVTGPATGLREIAESVDEPAVHSFVELYCGVVYRDRRLTDEEYKMLRRLLDEM